MLLLFAGDSELHAERRAALAHEVMARFGTLVCPVLLCTVPRPHRGAVLDVAGAAHRRFGALGGGAYLVRPDGYAAPREAECDADVVLEHLGTRFIVSR